MSDYILGENTNFDSVYVFALIEWLLCSSGV